MTKISDLNLSGFVFSESTGTVVLKGLALKLYDLWRAHIRRLLNDRTNNDVRMPSIIAAEIIKTTEYARNYPGQLQAAGQDFFTPSACFHFYPDASAESSSFVESMCVRQENGKWTSPFRLHTFTMLELVIIGKPDKLEEIRQSIKQTLHEDFQSLGISGSFQPATDSFFLGEQKGQRYIQKIKELKLEYMHESEKGGIALASINNHENYFTKRFHISDESQSFCVAFGIERLVAASLLLWGFDSKKWPGDFKL